MRFWCVLALASCAAQRQEPYADYPGADHSGRKPHVFRRTPVPGTVFDVVEDTLWIVLRPDEDARIGDVYQLRREQLYVGQVIVTGIHGEMVSGRFDTEFKGVGAPPRRGDIAYRTLDPVADEPSENKAALPPEPKNPPIADHDGP